MTFLKKSIAVAFLSLCASFPSVQALNEAVMTGTNLQIVTGQKVFQSTGTQGTPLAAWSQSGAPAFQALQNTHFENPAVTIQRSGTDGDALSITDPAPTLSVLAGKETAWNQPVAQYGGCLALSGDNYITMWGNSGMTIPGGIYDGHKKTEMGYLAIDPVHRQTVGPDGITPVLGWGDGTLHIYAPIVLGNGVTIDASHVSGLSSVATSGAYGDLSGKPTIPTTLPASGGTASYAVTSGTANYATYSGIASALSGTVNGNPIFTGSNIQAPNQTASAAASVMTRDLVSANPFWELGRVWRPNSTGIGYTGGGGSAGGGYGALVSVSTAASAISYGHYDFGAFNANRFSGVGTFWSGGTMGFSCRSEMKLDNGAVLRMTLGGGVGTVPAYADGVGLPNAGIGIEFSISGSYLAYRLLAHNGTTLTTGSWVATSISASTIWQGTECFALTVDCATGIVSAYVSTVFFGNGRFGRLPASPTATLSGGPTVNSPINQGIYATAVTSSTTAPGTNSALRIYDMLCTQF